jgi:hypothetical protein
MTALATPAADTNAMREQRPPLELVALAAWLNVKPEQLPADLRAKNCDATMTAWKRVADALLETYRAGVGEGWKLVPVVPTEAMMTRAHAACDEGAGLRQVWSAMLAAPPPAPADAGGWKLVPMKPTDGMIKAYTDTCLYANDAEESEQQDILRTAWAYMLSASPAPADAGGEAEAAFREVRDPCATMTGRLWAEKVLRAALSAEGA